MCAIPPVTLQPPFKGVRTQRDDLLHGVRLGHVELAHVLPVAQLVRPPAGADVQALAVQLAPDGRLCWAGCRRRGARLDGGAQAAGQRLG